MARKILRGRCKRPGFGSLWALSFLSLAACDFSTGTGGITTTPSPAIAPYTATLAIVDSAMDDFEGNADVASARPGACHRAYDCNLTHTMTTGYSRCVNKEQATLNGDTQLTFDGATSCNQNAVGASSGDYANLASIKKDYIGFVRNDASGQIQVSSQGGLVADYSNGSGTLLGRLTIFDVLRELPGVYSYEVSTFASPLIFSGKRALGTRQIQSGSLGLTENINNRNESISFSNLLWTSTQCCYPTAGTLIGSVTTPAAGTEMLQFTASCGQGNFTDITGKVSAVSLGGACD